MGECGVALQPLVDALKTHILRSSVLHADESPVQMLRPARQDGDKGHGQGHTQRAYCWAYSPAVFEDAKAVVYDFFVTAAPGPTHAAFLGNGKAHW